MSRITGNEVKNLMEAYGAVYAPQELTEEQVWEEVENWVNSLLEEGYDLSEYTWEEMYDAYLTEYAGSTASSTTAADLQRQRNALRTSRSDKVQSAVAQGTGQYGRYAPPSMQQRTPSTPAARPSAPVAARPAAPAARPATAAAAPARPATATAAPAKPAATQTGDKAKDMATWASANPKLAAAAGEKARIRGTQQTDNPLMKDMKSRLPMNSPSVQSPDVAKLGKGNQSLTQNPNAFKAAEPKTSSPSLGQVAAAKVNPSTSTVKTAFSSPTITAASSSSPSASGSLEKPTAAVAATKTPTPVAPKLNPRQQRLNMSYDAFDVIKGHLLDEGYADTEESALAIMANMSEEWKQTIINS